MGAKKNFVLDTNVILHDYKCIENFQENDIYLPFFKLCPELKFSFGLVDLLEKDRSDLTDPELIKYPNSLSKATSRMVTLTFNFE